MADDMKAALLDHLDDEAPKPIIQEEDVKKEEEEVKETTTTEENNNETTPVRHWDHTNKKLMVKNTLKFCDKRQLKKLVDEWTKGVDVQIHKTKKPPTDNWLILTLEKEEQVQVLMDHINSNHFTNKKGEKVLAVRVVEEHEKDEFGKKRSADGNPDETLTKRQRSIKQAREVKPQVVTQEQVKDAIIPLWRQTYAKQLETKTKELVNRCAVRIVKEIKSKFKLLEKEARKNKHRKAVQLYEWLNERKAIVLEPIIPAKAIVRNKCEFNFGYRYVEDKDVVVKKEDDAEEQPKAQADNHDVKMEDGDVVVKKQDDVEDQPKAQVDNHDVKMEDGDVATTETEDDAAKSDVVVKNEEAEPKAQDDNNNVKMEDDAKTNSQDATKTEPDDDQSPPLKKLPSVGAMTRGWNGSVCPPLNCRNIPSEAKAIVQIVEEFLADCPMPPYDAKMHTGFWRTLAVRSSRRTNECMLIFVHAPLTGGVGSQDSETIDNYSTEVFESEKARLLSMLVDKDLPVVPAKLEEDNDDAKPESFLRVTSVFFQEFGGISMPSPDHPVQHVYGEMALREKLGNCTFQISPGAFFQVNTETAEVLYNVVVEKVREITTKPEDTLCFDVCCGTGTIGLTLMKEGVVGKVVGVDISAPAIEDAKINAKLNGYEDETKTRFIASRAEHALYAELKRVKGGEGKVVAVVDPAREGLHNNVLKSIREFDRIDRLVYVSCNPTGSLIGDAAILCSPASKRFRGRPFKPTFAQPVDMFPYSSHCELVMVFDRMTDEEMGDDEIR